MTPRTEKAQQRLDALVELTQLMLGAVDPDELIRVILDSARNLFVAEGCSIAVIDTRAQKLVFTCTAGGAEIRGFQMELGQGVVGWVAQTGEGVICRDTSKDPRFYSGVDSQTGFQTRSLLCAPLRRRGELIGSIEVVNIHDTEGLTDEDLRLLTLFGGIAGTAIDLVRVSDIRQKQRDAFQEILRDRYSLVQGPSQEMKSVIGLAHTVAATDATVLLLGESGTGKEVLARSIHLWSHRAVNPFIALNCVALAPDLVESELFGHEKGSFTGAISKKIGKFELAQGGTLFLDEIGELPAALQTKLLRVLQDKEFQRVGGTKSIVADVRIVAATNGDLVRAIQSGRFREDLYYRLNVISLILPPLREHREDIPVLADHFVRRYCREVKRPLLGIAPGAEALLRAYSWPGNVRELQNVVERAVVLCPGPVIREDDLPADLRSASGAAPARQSVATDGGGMPTLAEALEKCKRDLIRRALDAAGGNQSEAAKMLGLQRPNLSRLMKALGFR